MKLHILTDLLERLGLKTAASVTREAQAAQGDTSIDQLFSELHSLIRAVEPAFEGILDIFLDSSTVVYAVSPEGTTELFRRKFTQGDTVGLSDKREQVQLKREFVPLEGAGQGDEATKPSSSSTPASSTTQAQGGDPSQTPQTPKSAQAPAPTTPAPTRPPGAPAKLTKAELATKPTKAQLVETMIASPKTTFRESDHDTLSSFSTELLARLASDLEEGGQGDGTTAADASTEECQCADGQCSCQAPTELEGSGDTGDPTTPASPTPNATEISLHVDGKPLAESLAKTVGLQLVSHPKSKTRNQTRRSSSSGQGAPTMVSNRAKDLALRLIACEESPFTEPDYSTVLQFTEERLHELVQHYTPDNPPPQSEEEWLETAPDSIRDMVIRYQAEDAQRRAELVLAITASQDEFTKEQLSCMKTGELEKLGKAMGLHKRFDYSGRGMPRGEGALSSFGMVVEPPEPYTLALEKREKAGIH